MGYNFRSTRLLLTAVACALHGASLPCCASIPPSPAAKSCSRPATGICAMETRLRPLTLGEILDRTAQLYRSHFWLFAGIASVYSGAILLLSLLQIGGQEFLRVENLTRYAIPLGAIWMAVMFFVSFVVGGIAV